MNNRRDQHIDKNNHLNILVLNRKRKCNRNRTTNRCHRQKTKFTKLEKTTSTHKTCHHTCYPTHKTNINRMKDLLVQLKRIRRSTKQQIHEILQQRCQHMTILSSILGMLTYRKTKYKQQQNARHKHKLAHTIQHHGYQQNDLR